MSLTTLRRTVSVGDFRTDEESRAAYSYDASGLEALPGAILKPRYLEQLRRILIQTNQHHLPVVPRGAGTGTRGGTVLKDGVIIDLRGFESITRLDTQRGTVDAGAGVPIGRLQTVAAKHGFAFPLLFDNPVATIGGLAATNTVSEESFRFGDWNDVVERVECFDGLGRLHTLKKPSVVIAKEGTTGIITSLRLKLVKPHTLTLDLVPLAGPKAAMIEVERHARKNCVLALEYLDARTSSLLGLEEARHLLVAYTGEGGSFGDETFIRKVWGRRKMLPTLLWQEGLGQELDFTVDESCAAKLIAWCEEKGVPCYGHLGIGLLLCTPKDTWERRDILNHAVALGATPGGKHGYGRLLAEYVPEPLRKEVRRLKEEWDYNQVLNPRVLV